MRSPSPWRKARVRWAAAPLLGLAACAVVLPLAAQTAAPPAAPTAAPSAALPAAELARGKLLFNGAAKPACATCHTLQAAGSEGQIGPVLDELKPSVERVLAAVRGGIGLMPAYGGQLHEADLQALARFVAHSSGGAR